MSHGHARNPPLFLNFYYLNNRLPHAIIDNDICLLSDFLALSTDTVSISISEIYLPSPFISVFE